MLALPGCAAPARREAPALWTCVTTLRDRAANGGQDDTERHCLAGALIARYCSVPEAYLAGAGKELLDLVGPGDAQWRDWRADRTGIHCAAIVPQDGPDTALLDCCRSALPDRSLP